MNHSKTIIKEAHMPTTGMNFSLDYWPIVHTSMVPNSVLEFYGTDTEEEYLLNLKRQPHDWIYRDKKIIYKFNSLGLRMNKEIKDVSKDYFVSFGCSHSVGVGINFEDTWTSKLCEKTKLDFINCSVSGSSIKLNAINFFNMLSKLEILPKAIAIAWPSSLRTCFYDDKQFLFYLPRYMPSEEKYKNIKDAYKKLLLTNCLSNDALMYRNMVKNTCKHLNIKYAELSFDNKDSFAFNNGIKIAESKNNDINLYYARDLKYYTDKTFFGHVGIESHLQAVESIIEQWK